MERDRVGTATPLKIVGAYIGGVLTLLVFAAAAFFSLVVDDARAGDDGGRTAFFWLALALIPVGALVAGMLVASVRDAGVPPRQRLSTATTLARGGVSFGGPLIVAVGAGAVGAALGLVGAIFVALLIVAIVLDCRLVARRDRGT
jgi:FtsH-binding integral membrane protein